MLPEGYTLRNLLGAIRHPERFREEYYRRKEDVYRRALEVNGRYYRWRRPDEGVAVMDADWDNLLILDACRPEYLEEYVPDDWTVERRRSQAPESREFMRRNFEGDRHHDTVYVTANPYAFELPTDLFHARRLLLDTHWNEDHRTVLPGDVVAAAREAATAYPYKRLIVHFMQPHFPFLGPTGRTFDHEGIEIHLPRKERDEAPDPWRRQMFVGDVGHERLLRAYRENHEFVVPHVRDLIEALGGRTVVTADHANLVGEWTLPVPLRTYGHPEGLHKDELLTVPWVTFEGRRRRIYTCPPVPSENATLDEPTVEDRLRDLGYA